MDSKKKWFEDRIKEFENYIGRFLEQNYNLKSTDLFRSFVEFKHNIKQFNNQSNLYFGKVIDSLKSQRIYTVIEKQKNEIEPCMESLFDAQENLREMYSFISAKYTFEKTPQNKKKLEQLIKILNNFEEIIETYKKDLSKFQDAIKP